MSFELKQYQRIKMRNGQEGILVANPKTKSGSGVAYTDAPLVIVLDAKNNYSNGYMPGAMTYGTDNPEWDIVAVWESPHFYGDLLDYNRKGALLWQEESKAVAEAKAEVERVKFILAAAEDRLRAAMEAHE